MTGKENSRERELTCGGNVETSANCHGFCIDLPPSCHGWREKKAGKHCKRH